MLVLVVLAKMLPVRVLSGGELGVALLAELQLGSDAVHVEMEQELVERNLHKSTAHNDNCRHYTQDCATCNPTCT